MLDAVALLGAFAVVEAVERADQIAGDAADALKADALANKFGIHFGYMIIFHNGILLFISLPWDSKYVFL